MHDKTHTEQLAIPTAVVEESDTESVSEADSVVEKKQRYLAWQDYYEQRQRLCYRHALVLETMLDESPNLRYWLEQHGFSSEQLIQYLRWNPAEQMRQIRNMDPERKARHAKQLHRENRRNLKRMEENIAKALLLLEDVKTKSEWIAQRRTRKRKGSMFAEEMEILANYRAADSSGESTYESKRPPSPAGTFVSYASATSVCHRDS